MSGASEILALFERWKEAVREGDLDKIVEQYSSEAILIPTMSNKVCHNHSEIREYFVKFLKKKPSCEIEETNLCLRDDIAINSGIYTFCVCGSKEEETCCLRARFSFVYQKFGNKWLIIEQHSSLMPEKE